MGLPLGLISQLRIYFAEYRDGTFAAGAPNDAVMHLTGREPEDFERIVRNYVEGSTGATGFLPSGNRIPATKRSPANRVRALINFARLLLTPAPNLDRYERIQQFPAISKPRTALQYEPWTQSHTSRGAFGSPSILSSA